VRLGPPRQSTKRGPPLGWKAQGTLVLSMYSTNYSKPLLGHPFSRVLYPPVCSVGKLLTRRGTITELHSFNISVRMLHIFKDILIIGRHLDLGGSDSDSSRSPLAIRNPTSSGSVADSPYTSTSSSVRDLPYSSTSSASNQEQSSLEEFSVSTDSGTSCQWFSKRRLGSILTFCCDAIQALVGAKYLPKSRLDVSLVSFANVLTPSSLHPQRAIPLKKNPVTRSMSVI
jgi:hypothetical protein